MSGQYQQEEDLFASWICLFEDCGGPELHTGLNNMTLPLQKLES